MLSEKKSKKLVKPLYKRTLFVCGRRNWCRMFARWFVNLRYFDTFILVVIILSTVLMAIETPFDNPDGMKIKILKYIDYVITAIFILECALKITVYGFLFNGPDAYLKNGWNMIDFTIVVFAVFSLIFSDVDLSIFKAIRMIRILRPLRMISRNQNLKKVVQSLIMAIPDIFNVMVISALFFMLFGILGVTYFSG